MRTRLLMAVFCILALPFVFSPSTGDGLSNSTPYSTVAFAGHVFGSGVTCDCGCPNCICSPGEQLRECPQAQSRISDETDNGDSHVDSSNSAPASDFDFGAGAMLFALALFVWLRLRA